MRFTALVLAAIYGTLSVAQSTSSEAIFTIQPITSIIPSSLISTPPSLTELTRTSTRIGGSQVEPTSFTSSTSRRLTVSDASTDRPPPSSSSLVPTLTSSESESAPASTTLPLSSLNSVASSAAASATSSSAPNAAVKSSVGLSVGVWGVIAALGGAVLV